MDQPADPDELLARARGGERGAFAALIRHHQRATFSLALRMLSHADQAEDVAQEAFVRLHQCLRTFDSSAHVRQWLRRVVINLAIDRLRRERNLVTVPLDPEAHAASSASEGDALLHRRLWQLIAALPADPRAVMLLRYQEDLDPSDIAKTLVMPLNTVKSHLQRSLATIRAQLPEFEPAATEVISHG